jgi:hypothetical protein
MHGPLDYQRLLNTTPRQHEERCNGAVSVSGTNSGSTAFPFLSQDKKKTNNPRNFIGCWTNKF